MRSEESGVLARIHAALAKQSDEAESVRSSSEVSEAGVEASTPGGILAAVWRSFLACERPWLEALAPIGEASDND